MLSLTLDEYEATWWIFSSDSRSEWGLTCAEPIELAGRRVPLGSVSAAARSNDAGSGSFVRRPSPASRPNRATVAPVRAFVSRHFTYSAMRSPDTGGWCWGDCLPARSPNARGFAQPVLRPGHGAQGYRSGLDAPPPPTAAAPALVVVLAVSAAVLALPAGGSTESSLAARAAQQARRLAAVSGDLAAVQARLDALTADIAARRAQQARTEATLRAARSRLVRLRLRQDVARTYLQQVLVADYESDRPDIVNVVLEAKGFADLLERLDRAKAIAHSNAQAVHVITAARAAVARQTVRLARLQRIEQAELEGLAARQEAVATLRSRLAQRQLAIAQAHARTTAQLHRLRERRLAIQRRLAAARRAAARSLAPAAPQIVSGGGFTFPLSKGAASPPVSWSPDQGVDISAPGHTPLLAVRCRDGRRPRDLRLRRLGADPAPRRRALRLLRPRRSRQRGRGRDARRRRRRDRRGRRGHRRHLDRPASGDRLLRCERQSAGPADRPHDAGAPARRVRVARAASNVHGVFKLRVYRSGHALAADDAHAPSGRPAGGRVGVVGGGTAIAAAGGDGPTPPPKPLAVAIHDAATAPPVDGITANIKFTNHLIDASSFQGSDPLLSGATGRLWLGAGHRLRLELQSDSGDVQIVSDGTTVSVYDASMNTVYRADLPQDKTARRRQPTRRPRSPRSRTT